MNKLQREMPQTVIWITKKSRQGSFGGGGSGFVVEVELGKCNNKTWWTNYVVTCRHVVEGKPADKQPTQLRLNNTRGEAVWSTDTDWGKWIFGEARYGEHPDIALLNISGGASNEEVWGREGSLNLPASIGTGRERCRRLHIREGQDTVTVGFPEGAMPDLQGNSRQWPIVRSGTIARFGPYLAGITDTFLIDGSFFPGQSGGPVWTGAQFGSEWPGEEDPNQEKRGNLLIGMAAETGLSSLGGTTGIGTAIGWTAIAKVMKRDISRLCREHGFAFKDECVETR